jgi:hypothetical protein
MAATYQDYFASLEVPRVASQEEIKKAYRAVYFLTSYSASITSLWSCPRWPLRLPRASPEG